MNREPLLKRLFSYTDEISRTYDFTTATHLSVYAYDWNDEGSYFPKAISNIVTIEEDAIYVASFKDSKLHLEKKEFNS